MPAPGQGALVVQVRADDAAAAAVVSALDDEPARRATSAERELQRICDPLPGVVVAAYAEMTDRVTLRARLMTLDGSRIRDAVVGGDDPVSVARAAAGRLQVGLPVSLGVVS
jgi:hydroxymethylbilane synthase